MKSVWFRFVLLAVCHSLLAQEPVPQWLTNAATSPDSDRPPPVLPEEAFFLSEYGNLELTITAARDGSIQKIIISKPSRAQLFDEYTRKWVEKHWRMPAAKPGEVDLRTFIAPIIYPKRTKPPEGGSYPAPEYPYQFRRDHIEGLVIVEMRIAESGVVESASTLRSSGNKGLDQHTIDWVRKRWKFPPGKKRLVLWPVAYVVMPS